MAVTLNTTWYVNFGNGSSTGYYAVAAWAATTAYTVGQIVRQLAAPAVGNERCFICIIAGTSGGSAPAWVFTRGAKTTDNTVTWMECSALPALNADLTNTPLSSGNRSGAQSLGNLITNNTQDHYFICTTAGTTGAGEPSYVTTTGSTTTDGGCVWTCIGAVGSFTTKWGAPSAHLSNNSSSYAAGDTVYVSSASAETYAGAINISFAAGSPVTPTSIIRVVCVGNAGNIPPQSADVTTGASISVTGNNTFILQGSVYVNGLVLATSFYTQMLNNTGIMEFENCSLQQTGSFAQPFYLGYGGNRSLLIMKNTPIQVANQAGAYIAFGGNVIWRDTPNAIAKMAAGSWPTTLFDSAGASAPNQPLVLMEGLDLSAFAGTQYFGIGLTGRIVMNKCKLAALPVCTVSGIDQGLTAGNIDVIDCDSGGNTYRHERWNYQGNQIVSTTAILTGGATNGTTAYSWQVSPSANAVWLWPFECLPIAIWNAVTGATRTVTVQGIYNGAALPNNDQIWLEVEYFGTASSTMATHATETKANYLASGSALTANTSAAWNSGATARANTHAYNVGDLISVTTAAAGQLYICTVAGTSAGSVPGGYATAADGTTVTDGGATFRAMMRFSMSLVLSSPQPQSAGYFNCYVKAALANAQYFVDPKPVLS